MLGHNAISGTEITHLLEPSVPLMLNSHNTTSSTALALGFRTPLTLEPKATTLALVNVELMLERNATPVLEQHAPLMLYSHNTTNSAAQALGFCAPLTLGSNATPMNPVILLKLCALTHHRLYHQKKNCQRKRRLKQSVCGGKKLKERQKNAQEKWWDLSWKRKMKMRTLCCQKENVKMLTCWQKEELKVQNFCRRKETLKEMEVSFVADFFGNVLEDVATQGGKCQNILERQNNRAMKMSTQRIELLFM
jgi:hypothetical protein